MGTGRHRGYGALVLALGARARAAVPGALTFRDQRDEPQVEPVVAELKAGRLAALVITVPAGVTWTLPAYELALLAAAEVQRLGLDTRITIVTPERRALEVFGSTVSTVVATILADREVRLVRDVAPRCVERRGLRLADGSLVAADHVIALPALVGRRISGVPADFGGFVITDRLGRVEGLRGVYAAGDMTCFPVKQGGLATQRADAIARAIARDAGASPPPLPRDAVLRADLFGAARRVFLEARLDLLGRALEGKVHEEAPWWPQATLFGRHVTPWMARQTPIAA